MYADSLYIVYYSKCGKINFATVIEDGEEERLSGLTPKFAVYSLCLYEQEGL